MTRLDVAGRRVGAPDRPARSTRKRITRRIRLNSSASLHVRHLHVTGATERLEHVEMVMAPGAIPRAAPRFDVMHLHSTSTRTTLHAPPSVTLERTLARVAPEVVRDEVGAARGAAPASSTGGQHTSAPRARSMGFGIGVGLPACDEETIDL